MRSLGLPSIADGIHNVASSYGHITADVRQLEVEALSAEHLLNNPEMLLTRYSWGLEHDLVVAYTANGLSPLDAALQTSLDAPLLETFLA